MAVLRARAEEKVRAAEAAKAWAEVARADVRARKARAKAEKATAALSVAREVVAKFANELDTNAEDPS